MDSPEVVITRFYDCFAQRDAEGMAACYADDVVFTDPAFGELRGERARDMWRMLCRTGKDLQVVASGISAEGDTGSAQAFGPVGSVLGRTPVLPFALRRLANRQLDQFQKRREADG